jgi:DNA repair exonuclease SbcCD nuclease subunit
MIDFYKWFQSFFTDFKEKEIIKVSKVDHLTNRYRKLTRLRNLAIDQNNYCKVYQANRLISQLTITLNKIHATYLWN